MAHRLPPERLAFYETEYDALIAAGFAANPPAAKTGPRAIGRPKNTPPINLLNRLQKRKAGVLAFMYDFRIPFDNNLVDRMIKVQQKVPAPVQPAARSSCGVASTVKLRSLSSSSALEIISEETVWLGNSAMPLRLLVRLAWVLTRPPNSRTRRHNVQDLLIRSPAAEPLPNDASSPAERPYSAPPGSSIPVQPAARSPAALPAP